MYLRKDQKKIIIENLSLLHGMIDADVIIPREYSCPKSHKLEEIEDIIAELE